LSSSPATPLGVVSLVPSVTETLLAWGARPLAVTRFCEAPDDVHRVGGTKNPDIDAIVALAPDLVIMDQEENRREDAEALEKAGVKVHATHVRALDDVAPTLRDLGRAVGFDAAGAALPPDTAPAEPGSEPPVGAPSVRLRVWVPIWRRPWMSIGAATYGSSLLAAAGLDNVCASSEVAYPELSLDQVASLRPDFVLAPSEPYRFSDRHLGELEQVAPTVFVDGQDLFWWGSRTPQAWSRLQKLAIRLAEG
jgi:ABC-type Fe3+-hydroxamate transport system substrate-binding protein